jgi:TolB-like protein/DNA-binding winged helix-turn-helix (wHTH) protein/Tfp pilus assembly protein PilF
MADRAPAHSRVRFGVFELDLQAGELRKSGVLLHLPPQPFKILALLASRPAELVTREEIRSQVWGTDTFVDFEHGLNFAIKKIRDALGDDAETPRYIETLPRRGYRFIAPVDVVAVLVPALGPDGAAPARAGRPRGASLQGRWIVAAVSGAVVAIAAVLVALNVGSLRDRLLAALHLESAAPPRIESIAVLPLENLSRDPEQEYFADGLTDALITDLGKISTLRVISRTSVMQYKGAKKPLPEIARELNVDAAVEGTVLRSGSRVRITAQLLQARTDRHLWAETYERDFEDVIRLERQMAVAIAHEVTGRLSPAQETRLARSTTTNPRAYDAYLRGRYFFGQRTEEPVTAAVGYFEQALREDPHFALAYSGLADCYVAGWWSKMNLPLAEKYAQKALALEPDLAEAHASLGIVYTYGGRFADAEKELRRALDLNPNYVMAHHWWSLHLACFGRLEESLAENERARQLDPFSLAVNDMRVCALVGLHEYDRAVEQAETLAAINPQSPAGHDWLARIYWIEGRVPDALAEERKAATLAHLPARLRDLDQVAAAFARSGLHAAQVKFAQLREKGYKGTYSAFDIACQYGVVGDKGKVLEWLNQACRDNELGCYYSVRSAPEFDCVRSAPRFHDLLRRMGLEQ